MVMRKSSLEVGMFDRRRTSYCLEVVGPDGEGKTPGIIGEEVVGLERSGIGKTDRTAMVR